MWNSPKTNWNENDTFNVEDYERIKNNLLFILEKLNNYSYATNIEQMPNINYSNLNIMQLCNAINQNMKNIENSYVKTIYFEDIRNLNVNEWFWDYEELNKLEFKIKEIHKFICSMEQYFIRSGVTTCGQNRIFQNRFRR